LELKKGTKTMSREAKSAKELAAMIWEYFNDNTDVYSITVHPGGEEYDFYASTVCKPDEQGEIQGRIDDIVKKLKREFYLAD
jgi:hypothetical protein